MKPEWDSIRVCWTHGRVNICRVGYYGNPTDCEWKYDELSVRRVVRYQDGSASDWRSLSEGDS